MDNDYGIYIGSQNAPMTFYVAVGAIRSSGQEISPRGKRTLELTAVDVRIAHPERRCLLLPHRKDSIVAKCAETLWMLSGRDDVAWLGQYLPRAIQFSDDGLSWRGAYGPRLRRYPTHHTETDQVKYALDCLTKDPYSRQAVISIWHPAIDTQPGKDIPCNNWIQFLLRDNKLHMYVSQRSSDVWWGFSGIDAFSWSILHQLMAGWLGVDIGLYHHFIGSFHLYEQFFDQADGFIYTLDKRQKEFKEIDPYNFMDLRPVDYRLVPTYFDDLDDDLKLATVLYSSYGSIDGVWKALSHVRNPLIRLMGQILYIYDLKEIGNWEAVCNLMGELPVTDMWVATLELLCRTNPTILDAIPQVTDKIYDWVYSIMLGGS